MAASATGGGGARSLGLALGAGCPLPTPTTGDGGGGGGARAHTPHAGSQEAPWRELQPRAQLPHCQLPCCCCLAHAGHWDGHWHAIHVVPYRCSSQGVCRQVVQNKGWGNGCRGGGGCCCLCCSGSGRAPAAAIGKGVGGGGVHSAGLWGGDPGGRHRGKGGALPAAPLRATGRSSGRSSGRCSSSCSCCCCCCACSIAAPHPTLPTGARG